MTSARFIIGDTREVTASLPDASVDLILTSPPFLALRSYLPADHPDKHREIGSEATPADFLDVLLDLTEEWARVLAPHGSICVELGDTYAGSGGRGGDYLPGGLRDGQPGMDGSAAVARRVAATKRQRELMSTHVDRDGDKKYRGQRLQDRRRSATNGNKNRDNAPGWPLDKSLCGIPTLYAWSLAYGRNLLRPERRTDPWRIRNVVAWVRPNPPVGALGDKFRPATSYMTIACKSRTRWFDLDAVRSDPSEVKDQRVRTTNGPKNHADPSEVLTANYTQRVPSNPAGAPPLDWWNIPTEPYKGSHYATWPRDLLVRPILAMCPLRVCTVCGEPSRRIVEVDYEATASRSAGSKANASVANGVSSGHHAHRETNPVRHVRSEAWSDCGHNAWRPGVVLDPFAGSGTTLAVATGHGRDAIGIDIDERNADLALERIGPLLLTVERHRQEGAA